MITIQETKGVVGQDIRARRTKRSKRAQTINTAKLTKMLRLEYTAIKAFSNLSKKEQAVYTAANLENIMHIALFDAMKGA